MPNEFSLSVCFAAGLTDLRDVFGASREALDTADVTQDLLLCL